MRVVATARPETAAQRFARHWALWRTLVGQELAAKYRGTLLGRAWPVVMPLFMLVLYGFVFGVVFKSRWPGLTEGDALGFVLNLFAGLAVHGVMAESLGQSAALLPSHSNFVRKMVFPLRVLVAVPLGVALAHAGVAMLLLVVIAAVLHGTLHMTALLVPVILLPYVALLYGLSLLVAALGVYLRDLGQLISLVVTALLFTAPIFYPHSMAPPAVAGLLNFNPITWPVDGVRGAVLLGVLPSLQSTAVYGLVAAVVLAAGLWSFQLLRRGFADLL